MKSHWMILTRQCKYRDWIYIIHYRRRSSYFHKNGIVSQYKKYDLWKKDFESKLPSYKNEEITFTFIANKEGKQRFYDGKKKHNKIYPGDFPTIYFIGTNRNLKQIQDDLFMLQEDSLLKIMRTNCCMFDPVKPCTIVFSVSV